MESKYSQWSAENATKAYLKTLKMGINKRLNKEPDTLEFISAIAAGNNAKLILIACGETTTLSTLLALLAAASQTNGRVICIYRDLNQLQSTKQALSQDANNDSIEFVLGDTKRLIREKYQNVDFMLNDCELENHQELLREMQCNANCKGAIVLRCNAFTTKSWECAGLRTQLLPIGDGLLVTRIANPIERKDSIGKKGHWVVKVDEHTGEEHVFRVRCPNGK
ncbi:uncharacterized protein LOC141608738 [Silene latifolia]|uniref:uncharacterized protein LOC141608738 n=1 Tax=Silene latifolia TaxID=37657 RepID=UPI003D7723E2